MPTPLRPGDVSIEMGLDADVFCGIGAFHIGDTQVRSSRLPASHIFHGCELQSLRPREVFNDSNCLRTSLDAGFSRLAVKLIRDHSFDLIPGTDDWRDASVEKVAGIDLVIQPAVDFHIDAKHVATDEQSPYEFRCSSDTQAVSDVGQSVRVVPYVTAGPTGEARTMILFEKP